MGKDSIDVLAIGNAIVDILAKVPDEKILETLLLNKNTMTLIDDQQAEDLYNYLVSMQDMKTALGQDSIPNSSNVKEMFDISMLKTVSGGSAANTVAALSSIGAKAAFIGSVGSDYYGDKFINSLEERGVELSIMRGNEKSSTARSFIIVTEDGTRTMSTTLGASDEITVDHIDEELVKKAKVVYLTAYLWDVEKSKALAQKIIDIVHANGNQVALALADPECLRRHRHSILNVINSDVDILFANEKELMTLFGTEDYQEAVDKIAAKCYFSGMIAALTCGSKGAIVIDKDNVLSVPGKLVPKVIDKTGAGSVFVSGFLYGYTHDFTLSECGEFGNLVAAETLLEVGARTKIDGEQILQRIGKKGERNFSQRNVEEVEVRSYVPIKLRHDSAFKAPKAIAIGSAAGGPDALIQVFAELKGQPLDLPIFITQHMPPKFTTELAQMLKTVSGVECHEAVDGEKVENGKIYIAPGDYHMLVDDSDDIIKIKLSNGSKENYCRPSVDPMMRSLEEVYGEHVLAVIMTGMGKDGLDGGKKIAQGGGQVIAQDQDTSVEWGMPGAVAAEGICSAVVPIHKMSQEILSRCNSVQ